MEGAEGQMRHFGPWWGDRFGFGTVEGAERVFWAFVG